MIIDSPLVPVMATGAGRSIPQEKDGQVELHPSILPVVFATQPHQFFASSHGGDNASTFTEINQTRNNGPQSEVQILLVPKGFYELEIVLTSFISFTPAGAAQTGCEVRARIGPVGLQVKLIARWAGAGSFVDTFYCRILALDELTLTNVAGITGATEHISCRTLVNAIRIL